MVVVRVGDTVMICHGDPPEKQGNLTGLNVALTSLALPAPHRLRPFSRRLTLRRLSTVVGGRGERERVSQDEASRS